MGYQRTFAFILSALFVVGFVAAVGTSTGGYKPATPPPPASAPTPAPTPAAAPPQTSASANQGTAISTTASSCEDKTTVKDRVLCRLQQKQEPVPVVEESCRGLTDPVACQKLYKRSEDCYTETGTDKDACLKDIVGFTHASVADEAAASQVNVKNYLVLLLYDVQDKVEDAHTAGTVTDEKAADIIARIVATKQIILQGGSKADILAGVADVKAAWKEDMQ